MRMTPLAMRGGSILLLLLLAFLLPGCTWGKSLLHDVRLEPHTTISPNADRVDDLTLIRYSLSRPASVSIIIEAEDGKRYVWRENEPREADEYESWFGGVVDQRVLPDGRYTIRISATPTGGGEVVTETLELIVSDADTRPPEIVNFEVTPERISPNSDGIRDEAVITYSLSKAMQRVEVYVLDENGARYPVPPDEIREATDEGSHTHRFDGGSSLGAVPPPDGRYTVVVEAYDAVGASSMVSSTLQLEQSGLPLAQITRHDVEFSTEVLTVGETLYFTTTVTNSGIVPIRTHGPEPGTLYESTTNYNSFGEPIEDGAWRLGLDFEGNRVYNGQRYPYRWQLGHSDELTEQDDELYLMPGQEVLVTGALELLEVPPRTAPGFWIGLVHENVRFVEDFVGTTYITIETDGSAPPLLTTPTPEP